jgi:hypothetical protein
VRQDLAWQFQIRYIPTEKKTDAPGNSSSYQAIMSGTHAGAVSKAKLRTEVDLSPAEGKFAMLEYRKSFTQSNNQGHARLSTTGATSHVVPCRRRRGVTDQLAENLLANKRLVKILFKRRDAQPSGSVSNRPTTLSTGSERSQRGLKRSGQGKRLSFLPEGITETL